RRHVAAVGERAGAIDGGERALHVADVVQDLGDQHARLHQQERRLRLLGHGLRALRRGEGLCEARRIELELRRRKERYGHPVWLLAVPREFPELNEVTTPLAPAPLGAAQRLHRLVHLEQSKVVRRKQEQRPPVIALGERRLIAGPRGVRGLEVVVCRLALLVAAREVTGDDGRGEPAGERRLREVL